MSVHVGTDLIYRNYSNIFIDSYFWAVFLGGAADPERPEDFDVYFDDFTLWRWAAGQPYAEGRNPNPLGTVIVPPNPKEP